MFDAGLVPAGHDDWQVFALDPAGIAVMQRLQPKLAALKQHYRKAAFGFSWKMLGDMPAGTQQLTMSVRLQLDTGQAPMVLLDEARLPVKYEAPAG